MTYAYLLPNFIEQTAQRHAGRTALHLPSGEEVDYGTLWEQINQFAQVVRDRGLPKQGRVGIFLEKRPEFVVAAFGTSLAGGIFVPINPILKPEQVAHIIKDCAVHTLVTSATRLQTLTAELAHCPDLKGVTLVDEVPALQNPASYVCHAWQGDTTSRNNYPQLTDADITAIFYTSGSTGRPKGVVLSHRNIVAGAQSVASYLGHVQEDRLLAALPLSFDAGFSQLTTAFSAGASVALLNYLVPRDILKAVERHGITGLTAVPPLWIALSQLHWPESAQETLRYFANTGGHMPKTTLKALRAAFPNATPYLMYGLTEAFRATYLPPNKVDTHPDSIGYAIPNTEILVLREDGSPCLPNEPGELVQRGPLVAQGYWNQPELTAERFKPLPPHCRATGLVLPEIAVFSGDTVRQDEAGLLYFVGRRDEMIKTSGYRVSPTEIEEVFYATGKVQEVAACGLPHPTLGQTIMVFIYSETAPDTAALLAHCRQTLPAYMVPTHLVPRSIPLPRNPNGKIDRKALLQTWQTEGNPA